MHKLLTCLAVAFVLTFAGCGEPPESADTALARVNAAQEAFDRAEEAYETERVKAKESIATVESLASYALQNGDEEQLKSHLTSVKQRKVDWEQMEEGLITERGEARFRLDEAKRLLKEAESR